jgi:hypothetical protein
MPKLAPDLGAAAWTIEDPTTHQAMAGVTQTLGEEHEQNYKESMLCCLVFWLFAPFIISLKAVSP